MQRFSHILLGVMALFLFVAANKAPVKSLLQDGKGNYFIMNNQVVQSAKALSRSDAQQIRKLAQGVNETSSFNESFVKDIINKTFTENKSAIARTEEGQAIMGIIAKYRPKRTRQGILMIDNRVVQATTPLLKADFEKLRTIQQENKQASSMVNKKVYEDFLDESIVSTGLKSVDPSVRNQYAEVMNKYLR